MIGIACAVLIAALGMVNRDVGLETPPSGLESSGLLDAARPGAPGELVVTAMNGTRASAGLLRRIRAGEVAGVILRRDNLAAPAQVRRLTVSLQGAAVAQGRTLPLLIMVDQEGGSVRPAEWLPPSASAQQMGSWSVARIRRMGRQTGRALRRLGINVDLAPVVDAPTTASSFLGDRAFSTDPAQVARVGCAFARGLADGGVIATLKHFPGLGPAGTVGTDDAPVTIDVSRRELLEQSAQYRQCTTATTLVMVANARYPQLTGRRPAVLSPRTYAFAASAGVEAPFITDDLAAPALRGASNRVVRAVAGGANLVLFRSPRASARAYRELVSAHTRGVIDTRTLTVRASKVRAIRRAVLASGP